MNWNESAEDYDKKVYSITKWKEKRDRILELLRDHSRILILGCGSEVYLQKDIIERYPNCKITLSDWFDNMIKESIKKFNHPNFEYFQENMLNLNYENKYDYIISTNSILMPTIKENNKVFDNCKKALKANGSLITYLPSYDSCLNLERLLPSVREIFNMVDKEQRIGDKIDGTIQSFHTQNSIETIFSTWKSFSCIKVSCSESEDEFKHFQELYGTFLSDSLIREVFEYFVVAKK